MDKYHRELHISKHINLSRFLHNKYNDLIISDSIRLVALAMVSLYVPIYLIQKNFSYLEVTLYEFLLFTGSIFFHYIVLKKIKTIGVRKILIISYFLNIFLYLILFYLDFLVAKIGGSNYLVVIGFINIMATVFYWTSHHIYFLKATKAENEGEKLGLLQGIPTVFAISAPLIGGVIITDYGFSGVFLISVMLLIVASLFLFFSENIEYEENCEIKEILDFSHMKKNIIFFVQGIGHASVAFVWPILLFVLSLELISMGFLFLFSDIAYALVCYFGGKSVDKNGSRSVGRIGAVGHGSSMVFRAFSTTILTLTTFQAMGGLFGGLLHVALDSGFYKHSHNNISNSLMNRELYMHLGRLFVIFIFLSLLAVLSIKQALVYSLVAAGLLTFSLVLLLNDKESIFE